MSETKTNVDWQSWLRRWDAQQAVYLPEREERFTAMFDALEALLSETFVAVDLACGPGSISQRLLARFPKAQAVAVDLDPVLLTLGQGALGTLGGRLRWIEADLGSPDWVATLGEGPVDAVLSTTALHWLSGPALISLYRALGQIIRPGGVFLNGDNMAFAPQQQSFARIAKLVQERREAETLHAVGESWRAWWDALAQEPSLADLFAERDRRFPVRVNEQQAPIYDLHEAALRDAGFREVGAIWQRFGNRVLLAVR